jgi:E3 ubiquitin-protein ligase BRE1
MQKQAINNGKILKLHEEQQKEHSKMEETIKLITEQIANQENAYKKHISAIENASTLQKIETGKYKELQDETLKRIDELEKKLKEKEREIEKEKERNKRQMEQNIKFQRENEQMKQKQHESPSMESLPTDQKEAVMKEIELSKYRSIVRCSMCNFRMKNVVLAKCMHSFCNDCISNCLANRNRKCPKCNHKFSQVDVKQLWLDD